MDDSGWNLRGLWQRSKLDLAVLTILSILAYGYVRFIEWIAAANT